MAVTTRKLVMIAAWGGFIVSSTGFYLQHRLIERVQNFDYYKEAMKTLRMHSGAVYYLGEPIKDKRFKLSDTEKNYSDIHSARFCIPVTGPKDRGSYYFWARRDDGEWKLTSAELELKSKPGSRLVILKETEQSTNNS